MKYEKVEFESMTEVARVLFVTPSTVHTWKNNKEFEFKRSDGVHGEWTTNSEELWKFLKFHLNGKYIYMCGCTSLNKFNLWCRKRVEEVRNGRI